MGSLDCGVAHRLPLITLPGVPLRLFWHGPTPAADLSMASGVRTDPWNEHVGSTDQELIAKQRKNAGVVLMPGDSLPLQFTFPDPHLPVVQSAVNAPPPYMGLLVVVRTPGFPLCAFLPSSSTSPPDHPFLHPPPHPAARLQLQPVWPLKQGIL